MRRKKLLIIFIILIAAVLIINEVVAYWPYLVMGAPLPVFWLNNRDSTNHNVNVQAFDSNNKIFLNKTYELQPGQSVQYPENGWKSVYDKDRFFPTGNYIFIITLDNNSPKTLQAHFDRWGAAEIVINKNKEISLGILMT